MINTFRVHNIPMHAIGGKFVCTRCLAVASLHVKAEIDKLNERIGEELWKRKVSQSRIPERFYPVSFENFNAPNERSHKLSNLLKGYCDDFENQRFVRPGFLFLGAAGRGKTHLACAMAWHLLEQNYVVRYASLPDLTKRIRNTYNQNNGETVTNIVNDLISADFLILDEIDLHGSSDSDYQAMYDIINGRYDKVGNITLAISNRQLDALTNDLNERIISRILSGYPPVNFDWNSYRNQLPDRMKTNS